MAYRNDIMTNGSHIEHLWKKYIFPLQWHISYNFRFVAVVVTYGPYFYRNSIHLHILGRQRGQFRRYTHTYIYICVCVCIHIRCPDYMTGGMSPLHPVFNYAHPLYFLLEIMENITFCIRGTFPDNPVKLNLNVHCLWLVFTSLIN